MTTIRANYCARRALPPEAFERDVLARVLYPHARVLRPLIELVDRRYFEPEREFVRGVGNLGNRQAFSAEASQYRHHPDNRRFIRRVLRVRASTQSFRRLLDAEA